MLNQKNYEKLAQLDSCDVIDGFASFVDNQTIKVKTPTDEFEITGDRIIINTGHKPLSHRLKESMIMNLSLLVIL